LIGKDGKVVRRVLRKKEKKGTQSLRKKLCSNAGVAREEGRLTNHKKGEGKTTHPGGHLGLSSNAHKKMGDYNGPGNARKKKKKRKNSSYSPSPRKASETNITSSEGGGLRLSTSSGGGGEKSNNNLF